MASYSKVTFVKGRRRKEKKVAHKLRSKSETAVKFIMCVVLEFNLFVE